MQYLALIYGDEGRWERLSTEDREAEMGEYMPLSEAAGRPVRRHELASPAPRRPCASATDETARHRRPVRGDEGGTGGLLPLRVRRIDEAPSWLRRFRVPQPAQSSCGRGRARGSGMKYLLLLNNAAEEWDAWRDLSAEDAQKAYQQELPLWNALFGWMEEQGVELKGLELDDPDKARSRARPRGRDARHRRSLRGDEGAARRRFLARLPRISTRRSRWRRAIPVGRSGSVEIRPRRRRTDRSRRVFREEWGRAVAILIRVLGDFERAEDAVQDAFTTAPERWPRDGSPRNPGAWIVATARNRAIDRIRRERTLARKAELLAALERCPARRTTMSAIPDDRLSSSSPAVIRRLRPTPRLR